MLLEFSVSMSPLIDMLSGCFTADRHNPIQTDLAFWCLDGEVCSGRSQLSSCAENRKNHKVPEQLPLGKCFLKYIFTFYINTLRCTDL